MATVRRNFRVENRLGLHMRAAAMLIQTVNKYDAEVTITKEGQTVNGRSIIGLMMLAAAEGTDIEVEASGSQATEVLDAIAELLRRKFDED